MYVFGRCVTAELRFSTFSCKVVKNKVASIAFKIKANWGKALLCLIQTMIKYSNPLLKDKTLNQTLAERRPITSKSPALTILIPNCYQLYMLKVSQ